MPWSFQVSDLNNPTITFLYIYDRVDFWFFLFNIRFLLGRRILWRWLWEILAQGQHLSRLCVIQVGMKIIIMRIVPITMLWIICLSLFNEIFSSYLPKSICFPSPPICLCFRYPLASTISFYSLESLPKQFYFVRENIKGKCCEKD